MFRNVAISPHGILIWPYSRASKSYARHKATLHGFIDTASRVEWQPKFTKGGASPLDIIEPFTGMDYINEGRHFSTGLMGSLSVEFPLDKSWFTTSLWTVSLERLGGSEYFLLRLIAFSKSDATSALVRLSLL